MINITVKVSGPGQCIHNQMHIIEKALKEAGYPVEVIDEYPTEDNTIERASEGWKITLVANHCPWGG